MPGVARVCQRGRCGLAAVVPAKWATGEVWSVQLDPTVGSEIQKTRPCVLVSPPEMHNHLRTVIVAPMTTAARAAAFRIPVTFKSKTGLILLG